ncbi:hypothetical protein [Cupriavidus campinensis]|uniref:Uncharacterized protein n=1 Tax=Cupriavidus campinensis TaxID=151783 RepID=A0ABY3EGL8_9BURK|nr:hypothetical protein [Cupriavidus campinensis]TSP09979.1 hypothetical protein FGG12_24875 [Cupriavidus campinensis]
MGDLQTRPDHRLARVARVCANSETTFVFGRYQTGEYGYKSELVDSEVNAVSHVRKVSEAEMIPFFYSLSAPKQGTWAVLILQKFKNLGIHDFIVPKLIQDFEAQHKNCRLHVQRLVPGTLANTILEGALVKSMRFVSYKLPAGVEDAFGKAGMKESVHEVEFVVRAARGGLLPKIDGLADVLLGKRNVAQIMTLPNLPYDTIKLELDVNGRRRTMDVGKPFKLSPNIDITEEVETAEDGHPVWDDVSAVAREFSGELLSAQGVKVVIADDVALDVSAEQMPDLIVTPENKFEQPIGGAVENLLRQVNGAAGGA